ncbi:sulfurtransferase [Stappia indica]|uniref:sulfurtransferase n=1 Tax=Stappia indica TaxID=538381 RepID=UPI001CD7210C|nr:sulfurtransferase [Stappia indica]MCA1297300.1 sulfurtransferase [Stappia indica]
MALLRHIIGALAIVFVMAQAPAAIAAPTVTPLVSTDWLAANLDRDDVLVLDIRSKGAKSGEEDYLKGHIPGALRSAYPGYWRTNRGSVTGVLPSVDKLEASLSELGVSERKAVVIVPAGTDSTEFGAAARIYWTLKYLGHDAVAILDGGHAAWVAEKRPLETGAVTPRGDMFVADIQPELLVATSDVAERMQSSAILVDGRPEAQFSGKAKHPNATRFGRIPGAQNLDQAQFFDADRGRLKDKTVLASLVPPTLADANVEIVSYCNTGHWAATNWFVLREVLGHKNVTLYDDSMVGWSQDEALPMASERSMLDDIKAFFDGLLG